MPTQPDHPGCTLIIKEAELSQLVGDADVCPVQITEVPVLVKANLGAYFLHIIIKKCHLVPPSLVFFFL